MEEASTKGENSQILRVIEALKQASHELHTNPTPTSLGFHSAIKALLQLDTEADRILSGDPYLSILSHHLTKLRSIVDTGQITQGSHGLRSFLARRVEAFEISRVAGSIESEIQSWIDRRSIDNLIRSLHRSEGGEVEEEVLIRAIDKFVERIAIGFDRKLQDLVLKSKVFWELETALCGSKHSKKVREKVAIAIAELIRFNKDVFVGQVLMGKTIRALISISSSSSLGVLCLLIKSIKSPIVDEIESNGEIPNIISLLDRDELILRVVAMDCVLEIGYYGRKEAIEAMLKADLVKKLVELQRSELIDEEGRGEGKEGRRLMERHPLGSCAVARFAAQMEVGEGLRQREKRALKKEVLRRVREASVSDAEAATIVAEVLWGSSF